VPCSLPSFPPASATIIHVHITTITLSSEKTTIPNPIQQANTTKHPSRLPPPDWLRNTTRLPPHPRPRTRPARMGNLAHPTTPPSPRFSDIPFNRLLGAHISHPRPNPRLPTRARPQLSSHRRLPLHFHPIPALQLPRARSHLSGRRDRRQWLRRRCGS
jgi:hypothetical protein